MHWRFLFLTSFRIKSVQNNDNALLYLIFFAEPFSNFVHLRLRTYEYD